MGDQPALTASGRRKKPDKWANLLKDKVKELHFLQTTYQDLQNQQSSLIRKERVLLQVLESLQLFISDVVSQPQQQSSVSARLDATGQDLHDQPQHNGSMWWSMIVSAVQQREDDIRQLYGGVMRRLHPHATQNMHGVDMLTAACNPLITQQVATLSREQLTCKLSSLAGKCALRVLSMQAEVGNGLDTATGTDMPQPLREAYTEFTSLVMAAMIWHHTSFKDILGTNLDTLQPFTEPLPQCHWLKALQQLQLSEQQLEFLLFVYKEHWATRRLQLSQLLSQNMQQQVVLTNSLTSLLHQHDTTQPAQSMEQDLVQSLPEHQAAQSPEGCPNSASQPAPSTAAASSADVASTPWQPDLPSGASSLATPAAAGAPAARHTPCASSAAHCADSSNAAAGAVIVTQEALLQERNFLMKRWLVLALHLAIVTCSTLTPLQQAKLVAASYPSVSRIDLVLDAYILQQQRQELELEQGKMQHT